MGDVACCLGMSKVPTEARVEAYGMLLIIFQILKDFYSHPLNLQNLIHQILLALPLCHHEIHVDLVQLRSPGSNDGKRKISRKTETLQ